MRQVGSHNEELFETMKPKRNIRLNIKAFILLAALALSSALAPNALAGKAQKWKDLPESVRATILANGGKADGQVDKESEKIDGQVVYEAVGKDKDGKEVDLVVNEAGKLVMTKDDDAADRAQEQTAKAVKAPKGAKFSHPRDINNPYLPMGTLKADILEGKEGAKKIRIERIAKPDIRKTFKIGNQSVAALAVEDREYENGELAEVAMDYFAQSDDGTVYYLGEDVDEYKNGKVIGHSGSWMLGKDTQKPGIILPGHPKLGDKFKSEDVSKEIHEDDEVVSLSEKVKTPAGTYDNCIKVTEKLADGTVEYKYYASGVGVVREVPESGDVLLTTHQTR